MKIKVFLFALTSFLILSLVAKAQFSLAEGTQITMADDSRKNIERLLVNDVILVFNDKEKVYEEKKVKSLRKVMHSRLIRITVETGVQLTMTIDQPFLAEKGWVSVDAEYTRENRKYSSVQGCRVGEFALYYNVTSTDYVEVSIIQGILEPIQTYIIDLDGDSAIIANGFLVGLN
jgi:hypothetical protein